MSAMSTEQTQETWQVEANGKIFNTNFAEMTAWIDEGALLRQDKVRKGNLRWIEAGKVPSLIAVFNAKDNGQPLPPPVVTTTKLNPTSLPGESVTNPANFSPAPDTGTLPTPDMHDADPVCTMHADVPASYMCETCGNQFCKACPNSYGGTVKICPFCGAMCKSLTQIEKTRTETRNHNIAMGEGFGFSDFARAIAYPFRFKTSLVLGAIMFMLFSLGQSAISFGGIFMMSSAIFCFMLANTLTFGVLANTVENFSQGKIGDNFMPSFDDFSLWDDVIHPFFLSIGVYIASFGPLFVVVIAAFFLVVGSVKPEMNGMQSDAARLTNPELPYAANAAKQSEAVKELLNKTKDAQKLRIEAIQKGIEEDSEPQLGREPHSAQSALPLSAQAEEAEFARLNQMIQDSRKAQLEGALGKTPETVAKEKNEMWTRILGYGILFILLGGICLLWGFFYFPAACAVAGYTRSFVATLNPAVGLDTIRRLGFSYVKILFMGLLLMIASGVIGGVLSVIFLPFNMPAVGNMPANAIGSLFGFYFSVVFSCVIGFALYKASDRLKLYS